MDRFRDGTPGLSGLEEGRRLTALSSSFADLVDHLGTGAFHPALKQALQEIAGADCCVIFRYSASAAPTVLYQHSSLDDQYRRYYLQHAYCLDPYYQAAVTRRKIGVSRCQDICDVDLHSSAYFDCYYKHTTLVDEIGLLCPVDADETVHVSLGRYQGSRPFADAVLGRLCHIEAILASLIRKHELLMPDPSSSFDDGLCTSWLGDYSVTPREQEVACFVLRAYTNASIAEVMGIAEETVKVHRKRLYTKLSISSQAELFMMFMKKNPGRRPTLPGASGSEPAWSCAEPSRRRRRATF